MEGEGALKLDVFRVGLGGDDITKFMIRVQSFGGMSSLTGGRWYVGSGDQSK